MVTGRKWCHFASMSALYMAVWFSCSIIAPFFPSEAIKKGANQMAAGLVIGAFSITSVLAGPPLANTVSRFGGKVVFLLGAAVCACSNIIFGVLDKIQNGTLFVTSALLLRVVEALGSSAAMIAAMATVGGNYSENAPQMLGLLETFSGLGFMIGPVIGTILYQAGGYGLPFYSLGGLCLVLTALNVVVLPNQEFVNKTHNEGPMSLLRIPAVWPIAVAIAVSTSSLALFNVGIAYHTQTTGLLSPDKAGVVFFIQGGTYACATPLFGYILNKLIKHFRVSTRVMLIGGCVMFAVSFLMIGPSPWLMPFLSSNLLLLVISCVFIGLSLGAVCVPSILDMVVTAELYNIPKGAETYGMASGVFLSCFHFGSFVGSLLGGFLINLYGFEATATMFAMANLAPAALVLLATLWEYRYGKGRTSLNKSDTSESRDSMDDTEETTFPLIGDCGLNESREVREGVSDSSD